MDKPLAGIKVVDLSRFIAGPYYHEAGRYGGRGDQGGAPVRDDSGAHFINEESAYFLSFNRNKKVSPSIPPGAGPEVLRELLKDADIIVENFRIGVTAKMGMTYEEVKKIKEDIIYCSITGYGHNSPYKEKPSFDVMIQGEAGLMSITGFPDGPPQRLGVAIADILAGHNAFEGILLALLVHQKTGRGQFVDVSLMDSIISILTYQAGHFLATGEAPQRVGNRHPMITPYEIFETKDGYVIFAVGNQRLWERFVQVLGRPELNEDPLRYHERSQPLSGGAKADYRGSPAETTAAWVEKRQAGVPCGRIRTLTRF